MAECVMPGASSQGRVVLKNTAFEERKELLGRKNSELLEEMWESNPWQWLRRTCNKAMDGYLLAEFIYFNQFDGAEHHGDVLESIEHLREIHSSLGEDEILLRLGWGSGFHSITGNWKFPDDHKQSVMDSMKYKSRKIAFWNSADKLHFAPMGFVILRKAGENANQELPFDLDKETTNNADDHAEKEQEKPFEPEWKTLQQLKRNPEVAARVIGQEGNQMQVQLFLEEHKEEVFPVRYPSGLPKDTYIIVLLHPKRRKLKDGFNLKFLRKAEQ
jgi:hypothetical protein